jgi:hypothetical protein
MSTRIAKSLTRLILLLITFECLSPVLAKAESTNTQHSLIKNKPHHSSILAGFIFEKMEEEEKSEEERDKFLAVELADFTRITILLSAIHTPNTHFATMDEGRYYQPSLFQLYCVYII